MKNSIKRAQSERSLSTMSNVRILREAKKYFAMAAAALALVACDKNSDDLGIDNTKDTPITIQTAGVAELMTRSTTTPLVGTEDAPVSMGVFVTDGPASQYIATNAEWTHDGTAWEATSTTLYEGTNSTQKIYAYYPYAEDVTGTIAVTASEQKDYLVATSTPLTSSTVSLTMTHALTKLVLETTTGTEIAADEETIDKVEVQNMYASGTWKIADNTWSDLSDTPDATLEITDNEVLVIPMASCESFPIVFTTSKGRVFKATISLADVESKLEAGTQYNITLKVGQDKVVLEGITAAPWGKPVEGGELETL